MPAPSPRASVRLSVGSFLLAAGSATAALQAIPSLQLAHRATAMASAFIPYGPLAFGGAAALLGSSSSRWAKRFAAIAVAAGALQAWTMRHYWPSKRAAAGSITLVTMNMRCDTGGIRHLAWVVESVEPDVVVVVGLDWELRGLLGDAWGTLLPYASFHAKPHLPECGSAVFSRMPLRERSSGSGQPVVEVTGDTPFLVLPIDLPTPSKGVGPWLESFRVVAEATMAQTGTPLVAAGDFNAVREHGPLRALLRNTGLRDAAEVAGAGWTPTFPSTAWLPPVLGLDHVLASPELTVADLETRRIRSQMHRAIVARIGIRPRAS